MKKKKFLFMLIMFFPFICMLMNGCGFDRTLEHEEKQIREVTVTYKDKAKVTHKVTIDLKDGKKIIYTFAEKTEKREENFSVDDSFCSFIEKNILTEDVVAKKKKQESDELELLWRIEVKTEEESYYINGFGEVPSYWNELLDYMGITFSE